MEINFDIELTKKQQEAYDIIHKKDVGFLLLAGLVSVEKRYSLRLCLSNIFANQTHSMPI